MMDLPEFKDETEEAHWWFAHQEELATAAAEGRLERGSLARSASIPPATMIQLEPAEAALAREQAQKRGLQYQAYLAMLIHEALRHPTA